MTKANLILVSELKCRKILDKSKYTDRVYQTFLEHLLCPNVQNDDKQVVYTGYEKKRYLKKNQHFSASLFLELPLKVFAFK